MDLSTLFKKKQDDKESYFGLFLRGESAVGFIFEIVDNTVKLIAKEKIKYRNGWEEVVDDVDELLSILENETQVHVTQCIFFIYSYFIDETTGEIKEQYKNVMKQLSKELDLKPLGFVECHEAVKDMLEKEEGTPLNSVMAEIDSSHVSLYVYKGGKQIYKDQSARTDSIVDDIVEMVDKRKDQYLLPSKMVIYGSSSLEQEAALIKSHNWKEDAFIQAPRLSILTTEEVLRGLANTFMEQIQQELGGKISVDEEEIEATVEHKATEKEEEDDESGFDVKDDIPAPRAAAVPMMAAKPPTDDGIPDEADKVGFVVGEDIAEVDAPVALDTKKGFSVDVSFVKNLKFPKLKFSGKKRPKIQIFIGLTVLLALIGAAMAEYLFHKAHLEVFVPADKISNELSLQGEVGAAVAGAFSVITSTSSADVKDEIVTTGQREVGEKAKGTVILNNLEGRAVSYSAGTKMTVDSVSFVLDSDVTIASASSNFNSRQAQTKEASVTAESIGPEYNIDKDKQLSIAGAPSGNFALSKGPFTGGTKKQLKTIAKKDIDELDKKIVAQSKKLNETTKADVPSGMEVLPSLTEVSIASAKYSGEVGQEADKVSVNAEVRITYFLIDQKALKKEIASKLEPDVPSGFKLDNEQLDFKIDNVTNEDGEVSVDVLGEATAVKVVDKNKILELLPGKSIDDVKTILKEKYAIEDVVVKENSSPLLVLSSLLPFQKNNITIDIRSN